MGMMNVLGIGRAVEQVGRAVGGVAEVFVGNRAARDQADIDRYAGAQAQFAAEFHHARQGWFDGLVDGMNRLPRPLAALGTLGLFVYAMADPAAFAIRMQGLAEVPEPLWWLLGAVVSFYFGARELHHYRCRNTGRRVIPGLDRVAAAAFRPETGQSAPAPRAGDGPPETVAPPGPAPARTVAAAPAPATPPPAIAPIVVNAADPDFNAAFEEWRALQHQHA